MNWRTQDFGADDYRADDYRAERVDLALTHARELREELLLRRALLHGTYALYAVLHSAGIPEDYAVERARNIAQALADGTQDVERAIRAAVPQLSDDHVRCAARAWHSETGLTETGIV